MAILLPTRVAEVEPKGGSQLCSTQVVPIEGESRVQLESVHLLLCLGNNGFVDLRSDLLCLVARPCRPHVPARRPASTYGE